MAGRALWLANHPEAAGCHRRGRALTRGRHLDVRRRVQPPRRGCALAARRQGTAAARVGAEPARCRQREPQLLVSGFRRLSIRSAHPRRSGCLQCRGGDGASVGRRGGGDSGRARVRKLLPDDRAARDRRPRHRRQRRPAGRAARPRHERGVVAPAVRRSAGVPGEVAARERPRLRGRRRRRRDVSRHDDREQRPDLGTCSPAVDSRADERHQPAAAAEYQLADGDGAAEARRDVRHGRDRPEPDRGRARPGGETPGEAAAVSRARRTG